MLILLNAHHDLGEFALPLFEAGMHWILELDTNIANGGPQVARGAGERYGVTGRSLALFIGATPTA
jgi:glycogen operon protein